MSAVLQAVLSRLGLSREVSTQEVADALDQCGLECRPKPGCATTIAHPCRQCTKCNRHLSPDDAKALTASVLDVTGWKQLRHVPLRCRNKDCVYVNKRVWYNYIVLDSRTHMWMWEPADEMFFFFTHNHWGVSTAWLRQHTQRMHYQYASFASEAKIHTRGARRAGIESGIPSRPDLKIKVAWFLWRVVVRSHQHLLQTSDPEAKLDVNLAEDLGEVLKKTWSGYPQLMLSRRLAGLRLKQLSLRVVVFDGNAKLCRRHCGRPVAELRHSTALEKYTATCCSEKPCRGSRRCQKHRPLAEGEAAQGEQKYPKQSEVIIAHRRRRILGTSACAAPYDVCLIDSRYEACVGYPRRWTPASGATGEQLREYWDKLDVGGYIPTKSPAANLRSTACRTHKEGKYWAAKCRHGGWLYAATPGGYIVHLAEYVGAESLPQRYFFLAELINVADEIEVVVHDDACHLRKFCDLRASDSTFAARLSFTHVKYIVDRMHSRGHVDAWCKANCFPTSPGNEELLAGINTSVCEQLFSKLGRHKFKVRVMDSLTGAFLLHELAEVHNEEYLLSS